MSRRGLKSVLSAVVAVIAAVSVGPLVAPADAAIRKDCGGRSADLVSRSSVIALVVRARGEEDDLYGGDHRYSACYGKHGRTRLLMDLRSPNYPRVGQVAFWKQHVALELTVDDATCGKYTPDECPTLRSVSAWNAKTGRLTSQGHAEGALTALAVSPEGALAWVEPALAPATGLRVRAVLGEGGTTTLATTTGAVSGLAIGRRTVRWTDDAGPQTAPVPERSVLP